MSQSDQPASAGRVGRSTLADPAGDPGKNL
nr:MAG TPA: hypothetical protein [Caudoviricetes sp.]